MSTRDEPELQDAALVASGRILTSESSVLEISLSPIAVEWTGLEHYVTARLRFRILHPTDVFCVKAETFACSFLSSITGQRLWGGAAIALFAVGAPPKESQEDIISLSTWKGKQ